MIYIDPLLVALNQSNPDPYTIDNHANASSTTPVKLSTLAFMDDTTLLSHSLESLTAMLKLANEFYQMNNTKINFNKAELITNRNPSDPSSPLTAHHTDSFSFSLTNNSFTIKPLSPSESFRFFGVWFFIKHNAHFVRKQCHIEYQLFAYTLARKHLTAKQLVYLHNCVLLPKVEYRLMCTILSESSCDLITAPMRKLIKHAGKFANTLPTSFLYHEQGLNMTNLFHRHTQNHIASFTAHFNSPQLSKIYHQR